MQKKERDFSLCAFSTDKHFALRFFASFCVQTGRCFSEAEDCGSCAIPLATLLLSPLSPSPFSLFEHRMEDSGVDRNVAEVNYVLHIMQPTATGAVAQTMYISICILYILLYIIEF